MAKPIREKDGKNILYAYLSGIAANESQYSVQFPPLHSLSVGPKTNLQELSWNNQWLQSEVRDILIFNLLHLDSSLSNSQFLFTFSSSLFCSVCLVKFIIVYYNNNIYSVLFSH